MKVERNSKVTKEFRNATAEVETAAAATKINNMQ